MAIETIVVWIMDRAYAGDAMSGCMLSKEIGGDIQ